MKLFVSQEFWRDVQWILLLALVSLFLGIMTNALRRSPLPLTYQAPKERFRAAFQKLNSSTSPGPVHPVEWITPEKAGPLLSQPGVIFLDVRSGKRFEESHVPGALSLPRQGFQEALPGIFPKLAAPEVKCIVVYCAGGDCDDSKSVAELLAEMRLPSIKVIKGGWDGWTKAGLPTETGSKSGRQP